MRLLWFEKIQRMRKLLCFQEVYFLENVKNYPISDSLSYFFLFFLSFISFVLSTTQPPTICISFSFINKFLSIFEWDLWFYSRDDNLVEMSMATLMQVRILALSKKNEYTSARFITLVM